jgi:ubiquitin carboxyl-terminal hydrolase 10
MSSSSETASNIPVSVENTIVVPTTSTPSAPAVPPQDAFPTSAATSAVPPAPAPLKKSWASLLHPSTSSSSASASAGPSRNTLPTSSVVGISIPAASATTQDAALHVSPSRRSELVRLSTSGPGASAGEISYAGSAAAAAASITTTNSPPSTKIRPRGLIRCRKSWCIVRLFIGCLPSWGGCLRVLVLRIRVGWVLVRV